MFRPLVVCVLLALPVAVLAAEAKFVEPPTVTPVGKNVKISFAVDQPAHVEVAVVDPTRKIVRHLAAGVLGKNPPPPLEGPSLRQVLLWDRTDDAGKPVAGPVKVRVGLGLAATMEKVIGYDPHTFRPIVALAVNAKGELFVLDSENTYGASGIRVFARDGKYLRTVMPYSASLPPEKTDPIGQLTLSTGQRVPIVYNGHGQNLSPYTSGMKNQTMAFDPAGNLVFFSSVGTIVEHGPPRFLLSIDPEGGAPPRGYVGPPLMAARNFLGGAGEGSTRYFDHLAVSPDGQFLYVSGGRWDKARHVIYRVKPTDTELPQPWLGELNKPGADDDHFEQPHGIATDSAGRIYVADRGNGRVVILSPDGKRLGRFPVADPCQVFVHPTGGQVYVTTVQADPQGRTGAYGLAKFEPFKPGTEPKKLAEWNSPPAAKGGAIAALDASADPPIVWLAAAAPFGPDLIPVYDRGDKLEPGKGLGRLAGMRQPMFVAADRPGGKVYVTEFRNAQRQIDLASGEMKPFAVGGEAAVDRDGFVYVIEGYPPRVFLNRYDRDGKPANFPGTDSAKAGPIDTASKGPNVGFRGHVVAPNGDLYILQMNFYGDGRVAVYGPDGKPKNENLIVRIPNGSGGIAVDRQGNVFVPANIKPADRIYPDDFKAALPDKGWVWWRRPQPPPWNRTYYNSYLYHWGSVFKFPPAGGEFFPSYDELGAKDGRKAMEIPKDATTYRLGYLNFDVGVKGALWQFHGYGPIPTAGLNWGDPSCVCMGARLSVDEFGRVYVPDPFRFAVNVLDANGNLAGRIGQYGNVDDPGLSLAWGVYTSLSGGRLFVGDMANRRVLMVDVAPAQAIVVDLP